MGFFNFFKRAVGSKPNEHLLKTTWSDVGVRIEFSEPLLTPSTEGLLNAIHHAGPEDSILGAYVSQLCADGQCILDTRGALISWNDVYALQGSADHVVALQLLNLPPQSPLRPILNSTSSLSEPDFNIFIDGWTDGIQTIRLDSIDGAVIRVGNQLQLLSASAWATYSEVLNFQRRDISEFSQHEQEIAWGRIRVHADNAKAFYASSYLETTYVLTPNSLRLPLTREATPFGSVLTVSPTFDGAPDGWLKSFDGFNSVQPHYDLTRGAGRVRVVLSKPVQDVLSVIKREMPGRKVAGVKAEKFIHNPWAFLGESAHEVLIESDYQKDRAQAGAVASVFSLVGRFDQGRISVVDLIVTEHFGDGAARTDIKVFSNPENLETFLSTLRLGLEQDRECFAWDEFDLTIDAESTTQLEQGSQLLHLWFTQPAERINFNDVYILDGYSDRIEGIGVAKALYVPVFQREKKNNDDENDTGWLPGELKPLVKVTLSGHQGEVLIDLGRDWVQTFDEDVTKAESEGRAEVANDCFPTSIPTTQARTLVDGFKRMLGAESRIKVDSPGSKGSKKGPRETLLVKMNFHGVDYLEERRVSLALPNGVSAVLPNCLRRSIGLKQHQLHGIAWFQNLVLKGVSECRGALLADDMGLGKTLQLLTLLGWFYEKNINSAPSVIFAPKSLLENWENETKKFFTPSFPEVLVLYGDELKDRKQPVGLIDDQLKSKGIVDLLRPGWAGTSKIIITTYEVLTAYEFSFAKQPFAFVICDEAQRIKTPGTLVTLAVKKLKADFRIACTGTPVENSLTDLWCLFDFVQPGLLGALEEFGKTYRRPIECETEDQKESLELLQKTISAQTLRRTKADIAAELPNKFFAMKRHSESLIQFKNQLLDDQMLEISLTNHQRILYKGGLKKLQDATSETDGRKRARLSFGALHLMKAVCAEPYCLPGTKFLMDKAGRNIHLDNSPKLKWLLSRLEEVRQTGEKAIVFTELREVQAALYYFLKSTFDIKPFIINGDSVGRQSYIDKFSATKGFDVIILSTIAAGAGLNVTAANHVFHFTRAWNYAKESQATDRAYRIGQDRDVHVYCPTVVADDFVTFEVRLDQLLKRKANLAGTTFDNGGLSAMLNGTGADATLSELMKDSDGGEPLPSRYLTMDDVDRMDGFSFEVFCCVLWNKHGYRSDLTPKRGGDGGIDVVAFKDGEGELIQCKSSINKEVGWDAIKEVTAGAAKYQARYAKTRLRKVAVTNQSFTSGAVNQAIANQVVLITRNQLAEMLGACPINNFEFDDALHDWSGIFREAA